MYYTFEINFNSFDKQVITVLFINSDLNRKKQKFTMIFLFIITHHIRTFDNIFKLN